MKTIRRRRAFSLIELLITVGVIAVGLLALVGVLAYGVKASRTGEMASLAVGHSVHIIELIRSRNLGFSSGVAPPSQASGINDLEGDRRALNEPPFQTDFEAGMPFTRRVVITRVGDSGSHNYDVLRIVCSVFWNENGEERSVTFEALHKKP